MKTLAIILLAAIGVFAFTLVASGAEVDSIVESTETGDVRMVEAGGAEADPGSKTVIYVVFGTIALVAGGVSGFLLGRHHRRK